MTDFLIRFNEYFPSLNEHCDNKSPRLFHADLSPDEMEQLEDIGITCCEFVQETVDWAIEYQGNRYVIQTFNN